MDLTYKMWFIAAVFLWIIQIQEELLYRRVFTSIFTIQTSSYRQKKHQELNIKIVLPEAINHNI